MLKKIMFVFLAIAMVLPVQSVFSAEQEVTKDQVIEIATISAKGAGIDIKGANVIYDEGGKLWSDKFGFVKFEDKSPNHSILKNGFLKNYRIVYFDFVDPVKDVWVFVDKDTGEVLAVYREE